MLLIGGVTAGVVLGWLALDILFPGAWHCGWKSFTGLPCAGCGGTRALWALVHGHGEEAFLMNPGAILAVAFGFVALPYAGSVVFLKRSPWRPPWLVHLPWRRLLVIAIAVNWIYLLVAGRA